MLKLKNHEKIRGKWAKIKAEDYTYLSLNKPNLKKFQKWISVAGSRCHKQNCYTNPALLFYLQFSYCLYVYWHLYITVSDKVSMKNSLDFKQWRLLLVIRWNHPSKHSCALSHTSPIDTDTQLLIWVPYSVPALAHAASSNFTHFHPILTFFHLFLNHKRPPPTAFLDRVCYWSQNWSQICISASWVLGLEVWAVYYIQQLDLYQCPFYESFCIFY